MNGYHIEIGDFFLIPLPNKQNAYGQYVFWDEKYGPLSQIFDVMTPQLLKPSEVPKRLLFPPVFIGFGSVFRTGHWQIIGSLPLDSFCFPKFRFTFGRQSGQHKDWKIYDGKSTVSIGELPDVDRSLEFLCGWSPQMIEKRIASGKNRFDKLY